MSAENTIEQLQNYCTKSSGDKLGQTWQGKSGTYFWNVGKTAADGIVNGVVRKLAGIDASGMQIWTVAGSFKISPDGTILRFTGLPKKDQTMISRMAQIKVEARNTVKESALV